jgi:hypothetical protein
MSLCPEGEEGSLNHLETMQVSEQHFTVTKENKGHRTGAFVSKSFLMKPTQTHSCIESSNPGTHVVSDLRVYCDATRSS